MWKIIHAEKKLHMLIQTGDKPHNCETWEIVQIQPICLFTLEIDHIAAKR